MNGLIDTVNTVLAIGNTAQTGTRQQTQGTRNNTSLIGDNITEQVASNNNTIQLAGVLNHKHSSRVNKMVPDLDLRELLLHNLRNNLAPQTAGSEDISLVQGPHGQGRVVLQSKVGSETDDTLDLGAGVGLSVHGVTGAVIFRALAEVNATGEFTDDVEVDAAADLLLERGALDQGGSGEVAGTQVAECAHLLTELKDTLLGADSASSPLLDWNEYGVGMVGMGGWTYRATDGTEEDGVGVLSGGQSLVGQRGAGRVDGRL